MFSLHVPVIHTKLQEETTRTMMMMMECVRLKPFVIVEQGVV